MRSALLLVLMAAALLQPEVRAADAPRPVVDPETGRTFVLAPAGIDSGGERIRSHLLLPDRPGPHPAVVIISGSGEGIWGWGGRLQRSLVDAGNAVLVLGKKGVAGSDGHWRRESLDDRAENVAAALQWLRARPEIDPARIGILGHSQGGYVAALVAARDERLAYAVLMAGPAEPVADQIETDLREHLIRDDGLEPDVAARKARTKRTRLGWLMKACGIVRVHYLCHVYAHDPAPSLRGARAPVLALFGDNDPLVPPSRNRERMQALLAESGMPYEIREFPRANHLFWDSRIGTAREFPALTAAAPAFAFARPDNPDHQAMMAIGSNRARYADGFIDTILDFAARHTRPVAPATAAAAPLQPASDAAAQSP